MCFYQSYFSMYLLKIYLFRFLMKLFKKKFTCEGNIIKKKSESNRWKKNKKKNGGVTHIPIRNSIPYWNITTTHCIYGFIMVFGKVVKIGIRVAGFNHWLRCTVFPLNKGFPPSKQVVKYTENRTNLDNSWNRNKLHVKSWTVNV